MGMGRSIGMPSRIRTRGLLACAALALAAAPAAALTAPFTEDFGADAAGWLSGSFGPLDFQATGGPEGGSYVSTTASSLSGNGTIQFRGHASNGASGGAFVGDWEAAGVTSLSAFVRHDAPEAVTFFFRIATAGNFPGHIGLVPVPVVPNVWTEISVLLDSANPLLIAEGGTFSDTFGNVGNVQVGTSVSNLSEGLPFTWQLDKVTIVPEPGTASLLALGLLGLATRRRAAWRSTN